MASVEYDDEKDAGLGGGCLQGACFFDDFERVLSVELSFLEINILLNINLFNLFNRLLKCLIRKLEKSLKI